MEQGHVFGGRYRVVEVLGDGGMARVYTAVDERLDRLVALKTLRPHYTSQPAFVARFEQEAKLAANLNHPNIVAVYDIGRDDEGAHYIVMEYVEGETLKSLIARDGPLDLHLAGAILWQICLALDYAHGQGVIHRDIKPENIFLTPQREVKVGDFGIARALDSTGMTSTGQVLGSATYFAPEQAQGRPPTAQTDLYSTGIVLYEMLTRHVPFVADTSLAVALKHVSEAPSPPSAYNPRLSPDVDRIVLKALAKEPAGRYRSGAELAEALASAPPVDDWYTVAPAVPAEPVAPVAHPTLNLHIGRVAAPDAASLAAASARRAAVTAGGPGRRAGTGFTGRAGTGFTGRAIAHPSSPHYRRMLVPLAGVLLLLGIVTVSLATRHGGENAPGPRRPAAAGSHNPRPTATTAVGTYDPRATATRTRLAVHHPRPISATATARPVTPVYRRHRKRRARVTPTPPAATETAVGGAPADSALPGATVTPADTALSAATQAAVAPVATTPAAVAPVATTPRRQETAVPVAPPSTPAPPRSDVPTTAPTVVPSVVPTAAPPTIAPTVILATVAPTVVPSVVPTAAPHGAVPTEVVLQAPTEVPTANPPTQAPIVAAPTPTDIVLAAPTEPAAQPTVGDAVRQAEAAVYYADTVYLQVMNARDTSGVETAFGPALAATNRAVAADLAAKHEHWRMASSNLSIAVATPLDANTVQVRGSKTESAVLLSDTGAVISDHGAYPVTFVDIVRRLNGAWVVDQVYH